MGKIVYNGREYLSAGTASTMQGATSTTDGVSGLVPQPLIADKEKFLKGDGTWGTANEVEANPSGTATDELKKIDIDGTIYDINKSYLIQNAEIYSEDEKQVGAWIDGRPLYRKTVKSTTTPSSSTWTSILLDLPSDAVIKMYSAYYRRTNNRSDLIPQYNPSSNDDWLFGAISSNNFVYKVSSPYITNFVQTDVIVTYIKSNDAAGSGGYQAWGFSPIIYSTEEREIGVWIDNKPLYQKTIDVGQLPNNNTKSVTIDGNIDLIISYDGFVYSTVDRTSQRPLPMVGNTNDIRIDKVGTNLRLITYSEWSTYNGFVNITYTKTTDTAGSGSYNTLGVPNVHYDGNEKVIGTWFDETLYETTLDLGSERVFSSGWNSVVAHQNKYNLIFDGKLISPSKLGYNVDLACNDTTNLELHTNHNIQGRYLTFKYTKTS